MKIYEYQHKTDFFSSKILDRYFEGMRLGIFDIETLGLSPERAECVLAGLMKVAPDGSCTMRQYFAESAREEAQLLNKLFTDLNGFDYLLTYNGKHFDLPFITKRAQRLGLAESRVRPYNLDLYLCLNGHSEIRNILPSLKQKSVEAYMGLAPARGDEIDGKESITLYRTFEGSFDEREKNELRRKILLHNHDDILQLYKIFPIILQTDIHKAMSSLGFPIAGQNGWPQLNVAFCKISGGALLISGNHSGDSFLFSSYQAAAHPYDCHFYLDGSFELALPLEQFKGNAFLNVKACFGDDAAFVAYPAYTNGYLILSENQKPNYLEMNMLAREILQKMMRDFPHPNIT